MAFLSLDSNWDSFRSDIFNPKQKAFSSNSEKSLEFNKCFQNNFVIYHCLDCMVCFYIYDIILVYINRIRNCLYTLCFDGTLKINNLMVKKKRLQSPHIVVLACEVFLILNKTRQTTFIFHS